MDPVVTGALINAGSSLLGGLLGGNTNNHAGRDQRQATSYANYSAVVDKVRAAKDAGISPLYALGAPVISASSAVGQPAAGGGIGDTLKSMGQDIGRAVSSQQTIAQREATRLALESAQLDNDIKRSQLQKMSTGLPPVMPIVGSPGGADPASSPDAMGSRPDTIVSADNRKTVVDKGVTPYSVNTQEYGQVGPEFDSFMHWLTDRFVRPGNVTMERQFGPAPDPWTAGAMDAQELRAAWHVLQAIVGARASKISRFPGAYDRVPY